MISVLLSPSVTDRELATSLERSGARVWAWPELAIDNPDNEASLSEAISNLFGYDWLILKNAQAADYFLRRFLTEHQPEELEALRVLTIGPEAAERASKLRVHVDIALDRFSNAKLFSEIESYCDNLQSLARLNFLVPSASVTRELFEQQLEDAGARVDSVTTYRTCSDGAKLTELRTLLIGGAIDCLAFTNPSAISEFAGLLDTDDLGRLLAGTAIVCRDDATNAAANEFGLTETLRPSDPSTLTTLLKDLVN
jgi:uroporphyrinogen-III synthase